jgi:hypothetical protein
MGLYRREGAHTAALTLTCVASKLEINII